MTCRNCELWDIEKAKDKAGRVRRTRFVRCLWVPKEVWPQSVSNPSYLMYADAGKHCPCFQQRKEKIRHGIDRECEAMIRRVAQRYLDEQKENQE